VAVLASALRLSCKIEGKEIKIEEQTVERQCEDEFIQESAGAVGRNEAILSLACGAGVQAMARRFASMPVLPGVNTTFMGVLEKPGLFTEECSGCGDCKLAVFAEFARLRAVPRNWSTALRRVPERALRNQFRNRLRLAPHH
jgi:hypothetical protein